MFRLERGQKKQRGRVSERVKMEGRWIGMGLKEVKVQNETKGLGVEGESMKSITSTSSDRRLRWS